MDATQVVVATIGLIGITVTAGVGYLQSRAKSRAEIELEKMRAKLTMATQEMSMTRAGLDFSAFLADWDGVLADLRALMDETCIDRFLILRAWNGNLDPKWTTAVFQYREGGQRPRNYVHFELDEDYVERLHQICRGRPLQFNVQQIPDSAIKRVYEEEGVTGSLWCHLHSREEPGAPGCHSITYCSFATHSGEIDEAIATRCVTLASRLKGVAEKLV